MFLFCVWTDDRRSGESSWRHVSCGKPSGLLGACLPTNLLGLCTSTGYTGLLFREKCCNLFSFFSCFFVSPAVLSYVSFERCFCPFGPPLLCVRFGYTVHELVPIVFWYKRHNQESWQWSRLRSQACGSITHASLCASVSIELGACVAEIVQ